MTSDPPLNPYEHDAAVWQGKIYLPAGTTTLQLESDNGSSLFLDGQNVAVLDNNYYQAHLAPR